jgi:hypothetical protein
LKGKIMSDNVPELAIWNDEQTTFAYVYDEMPQGAPAPQTVSLIADNPSLFTIQVGSPVVLAEAGAHKYKSVVTLRAVPGSQGETFVRAHEMGRFSDMVHVTVSTPPKGKFDLTNQQITQIVSAS